MMPQSFLCIDLDAGLRVNVLDAVVSRVVSVALCRQVAVGTPFVLVHN